MTYVPRADDLKAGNPIIDSDHRHLIDLVNQLREALAQTRGKDVPGTTLNEPTQYPREHFKREEDHILTAAIKKNGSLDET